jgi:hypothetical protein
MKRMMSGITLLSALALAVACGDPTGDLRNGPVSITANPSFLVVDVGATKRLTAQVTDAQGNPLGDAISVLAPTSASVISVAVDDSARLGHPDPRLTGFKITGNASGTDTLILGVKNLRDTIPIVVP